MKFNFICTFIITVVLTGCSSKPVSITSLEMLNSIDSSNFEGKKIRYKVDFFLVDGYQNDDNTRKILDSFIEKHKVVDFTKVDQYEMIFYKESAETNSKNILSSRPSKSHF